MTGALDCLERHGHTRRRQHPTDRRMVGVSLTQKGRNFIERRLPERFRRLHRVIGVLTADERRTLLRAYPKIIGALSKLTDG
jgi:MarR family 2-MHQ and catechol resistance regulon transcriptional repressor